MTEFKQNTGVRVLLFLLIVVLVISGVSYIYYHNLGNRLETVIESTYNNNKNIAGTCTNQVLEVAQVPGMYRDDLIKVVEAEMTNRYGNDKTVVNKFIQERALNYDSNLYSKVQNVITACANRFEKAQKVLIDNQAIYELNRGNFYSGFWLSAAGYPKKDLSKFKLVLAESTDKEFETGKRSPIQLR